MQDKVFARQCAQDWWSQTLTSRYSTPDVALCDGCNSRLGKDQGFLCNPIDAPSIDFIHETAEGEITIHPEWLEWIFSEASVRRGGLPGLGTERTFGLPGPHLVCERCADTKPYAVVDPNFYLWYVAEKSAPRSDVSPDRG